MSFKLSNTALSAEANAFAALCNNGLVKIYTGTQPTNPQTAIGAQVLLATLTFAATAFGAAANGVATAGAIASGVAVASGTAAWFRAFKSDGTTVVCDGTVSATSGDIVLNTVTITSGDTVACSSLTYTRS